MDYCVDDFAAHFEIGASGLWLPRTESAVFTLRILRLNSDSLVRQRLFLRDNGFAIDRSAPS